jgi:hypothetical protein
MSQPGPDLRPVMSRAPSTTGTEKALSMWKLDASKTLIVSVRGTASVADHMVNMNADPKRTSPLFVRTASAYVGAGMSTEGACLRTLLRDKLDTL